MSIFSLLPFPQFTLSTIAVGTGGATVPSLKDFRVGNQTKADIRAVFGAPSIEWSGENGSTIWEYAGAVVGQDCFMLSFDAQGTLCQVEQAVTLARLEQVQPGMSGMDVRRLLGRPSRNEFFRNNQQTLWTWVVKGEGASAPPVLLEVFFDSDGRVLSTRHS